MGNKQHYDLKVAVLCEIERHRAEMASIKDEATAAGYSEEDYIASTMEVMTELGGVMVVSKAPTRRLNG